MGIPDGPSLKPPRARSKLPVPVSTNGGLKKVDPLLGGFAGDQGETVAILGERFEAIQFLLGATPNSATS